MSAINSNIKHKATKNISVWSVDRIGRLFIGIVNVLLILATWYISNYFILGLCFINLNLVFSSLTDFCPFRNFLKKLGAKEREEIFLNKNSGFHHFVPSSDSVKITLPVKQKN